jgi:putative phage-type endonuclease
MQSSVKEDRYKFIGGSDIPCILNLSPFKTRFQLLLEKAQLEDDEFDGNAYTEYGNEMEGKIRDFINKTYKTNFVEGKHVIEAKGDEIIGIRCHTDGENEDTILEVKTTSEIHEELSDYKIYLVQILFYMLETGKSNGMLAVYARPEDMSTEFDADRLQIFRFTADKFKDLLLDIVHAVDAFIQDLKKVRNNPFITEEELLPSELIETSNKIVLMEQKLADMKRIEAEIKDMKSQLKDLMEQYGVPKWETPNGTKITLVADSADKVEQEEYFDAEAFQADHPRMYKTYRKVREVVKKGKKGYVKITLPKE